MSKGMGFKAAQQNIAKKEGVSADRAGAILAAGARKASPAAKRANPNLKRVRGAVILLAVMTSFLAAGCGTVNRMVEGPVAARLSQDIGRSVTMTEVGATIVPPGWNACLTSVRDTMQTIKAMADVPGQPGLISDALLVATMHATIQALPVPCSALIGDMVLIGASKLPGL